MTKKIFLIIGLLTLLTAALYAASFFNIISFVKRQTNIPQINKQKSADEKTENTLALAAIAQNLEVPWALAFLPDGNMILTERRGFVRFIDKNGNLKPEPIAQIAVKQIGESGLHGISPHPNFSSNHFVYIYYTYGQMGNNTLNRISRFVFENNSFGKETVIVDGIPGAQFHDGGRIKFGPDGFLYITTGDALDPSLAQDKNSLAGKILRVTEEGKSAPGNPFNNLIYSYGHRNPQGIAWDSQGRLWETEHGQSATDELNLIEVGQNYGWPTIRGDEKQENLKLPILHSNKDTWAPAGLAYLNGSLYFGGLRGQTLFEAKFIDSKVEIREHLKGQLGRIRDVVAGPDNMLYITTSNRDGRGIPSADDDKIIRINPSKLE